MKKKVINLCKHNFYFNDGSMLEPSGLVAQGKWVDIEKYESGLTLLKRTLMVSDEHIEELDSFLGNDKFGLVSAPIMLALRGTKLEGRVGAMTRFGEREYTETRIEGGVEKQVPICIKDTFGI